jgi:hypothetical protein
MAIATLTCATLPRMATKKLSKSHSSTRKKRSATTSTSSRTKKAASLRSKKAASSRTNKAAATKARKSAPKAKPPKPKKETTERLRKRIELTLKAFRMAYEANQRGEFQRL